MALSRNVFGIFDVKEYNDLEIRVIESDAVRLLSYGFYQRVSIASYANRWYSQRKNVRLSVCLSVTLRY